MESTSKEQLRTFIEQKFLRGRGTITDDESLYESNVIDSLSMLELIGFVEKTFQVTVSPLEVTIDNFDSVNHIVQFVERKRSC